MTRNREDGQTLVLFALILTVLIGFAALVVDIGLKYSTERRYQAIADAASLAGAQELQPVKRSDPVDDDMRKYAREAALQAITDELLPVGVTATCVASANITDCPLPGGQYEVSIITPSPECVDCEPDRAVQVTVTEPRHQTGFARVFGQTTWNLSRTSVAGLSFGKSYVIVALRPVRPSGASTDVKDIRLDGNTIVRVVNGDVGTNSNMDYNGSDSLMDLQTGYRLYYADPGGPSWAEPPPGTLLGSMIEDPIYPIPAVPTTEYSKNDDGRDLTNCQTVVETKVATVAAYATLVPLTPVYTGKFANVKCYLPGKYLEKGGLADGLGELLVLLPGLYYFNEGVDIKTALIGGFDPTVGGVSLMFRRDKLVQFKQRSGVVVLNAGTKFHNAAGAEPAAAPAMTNTVPPVKITIIVDKDLHCRAVLPYDTLCDDLFNNTIDLAGGAALYLAGVQYAPTDNVKITGSSDGEGYVGQVWGWTLYYRGTSRINQEGFAPDGPGRIRIDTACSPGDVTACN